MKGRGKKECVYFFPQHKMMSALSVKANSRDREGHFMLKEWLVFLCFFFFFLKKQFNDLLNTEQQPSGLKN